ncbi:hypothetical protein [Sporosarcina sp. ZBG7A]|uniref:hypothetical protein n=1 Tax=Sporosarcina sp. ZBG7A TaxID=1582223 RepID=UPI000B326F2F|nr:hypothetical protein [Sporosarcina sp. ZBG7A]
MIRVGTPVNGTAISFEMEIKDAESIESMRTMIREAKEIDEPKDLARKPDTFFTLERRKEGIAEMWFYVFYQDDDSSILYNDGANIYFTLSKQETNVLRSIIGK